MRDEREEAVKAALEPSQEEVERVVAAALAGSLAALVAEYPGSRSPLPPS